MRQGDDPKDQAEREAAAIAAYAIEVMGPLIRSGVPWRQVADMAWMVGHRIIDLQRRYVHKGAPQTRREFADELDRKNNLDLPFKRAGDGD